MIKIILIFMMVLNLHATSIVIPDNFKADFEQIVTNPKKKVLNYSGNVLFSTETLIKWVYLKPTKKEVCTNGKALIVVDHDLEQASYYRINKGFDFAKILGDAVLHSKNIYVANYDNKKYTIKVDSKQKLQSIAYFDNLDNKIQIVFKHVKYGKGAINEKEIACSVPKEYDIIKG